jgi:hypothetical protein
VGRRGGALPPLDQELRRRGTEEDLRRLLFHPSPLTISTLPPPPPSSSARAGALPRQVFPHELFLRSASSLNFPHELDAVTRPVAKNWRRLHPSVANARGQAASPLLPVELVLLLLPPEFLLLGIDKLYSLGAKGHNI